MCYEPQITIQTPASLTSLFCLTALIFLIIECLELEVITAGYSLVPNVGGVMRYVVSVTKYDMSVMMYEHENF